MFHRPSLHCLTGGDKEGGEETFSIKVSTSGWDFLVSSAPLRRDTFGRRGGGRRSPDAGRGGTRSQDTSPPRSAGLSVGGRDGPDRTTGTASPSSTGLSGTLLPSFYDAQCRGKYDITPPRPGRVCRGRPLLSLRSPSGRWGE